MEDLQKELRDLTIAVQKANSFWRSMLKALLTGIAGAIGASLVAGIIIGVLSFTIRSVYDLPIIGKIIQNTHLDEVLKSDSQK